MKKTKFQEYVNAKGKLQDPVVTLDGDNVDPKTSPTKPPQGGSPYSVSGTKTKKSEKGLGDEGDDELKIKISNGKLQEKSPAKIPTVDEVSIASRIANTIAKNPVMIETIIRQLKANGCLGMLIAEVLNYKETFSHISEVMSHNTYGPELCMKLIRAMNEEVAPPFSDQLDDEEEDLGDDAMDPNMNADGMDDEDLDDIGGDDMGNMGDENINDMEGNPDVPPPEMEPDQGTAAMKNFQRAMMRSYMKKMMSKI